MGYREEPELDHRIEFIDNPPCVTVTTSGEADWRGWYRYYEELVADRRFRPGLPILIDHSAIDASSLSTAEVGTVARIAAGFEAKLQPSRRAIVVSDALKFGLARMVQGIADPDATSSGIFRSREEALEWLARASRAVAGAVQVVCVECGTVMEGAERGWRAYVAKDGPEAGSAKIVTYCPACAEREFGD